ncbi:MAG: hypothetical protein AB7D06_00275 [Pedobacter sp.]
MPRILHRELSDPVDSESSAFIRDHIERARDIQRQRFEGCVTVSNAHMTTRQMRRALSPEQLGWLVLFPRISQGWQQKFFRQHRQTNGSGDAEQ